MEEQASYESTAPAQGRTAAEEYPIAYVLAYLQLRRGNAILQATREHLNAALDQLAAAEAQATELLARATRAEHERDQWMQEASAHAKRAAVLDGHGVAPYCDGKCGICHCEPFNL